MTIAWLHHNGILLSFNHSLVAAIQKNHLRDVTVGSRNRDTSAVPGRPYSIQGKSTPEEEKQQMDKSNKIANFKNMVVVFNHIRSIGFKKNNYGYC